MDRFGLSAQFEFNSGNSATQIAGISKAISGLIDTIQDLDSAVNNSDNFAKKMARQLDFAPKKTQMRGVAKDVEAIGKAATNAKKNLSPLKDEFRALRAESRNIDMGEIADAKQYKKGKAELIAYTKSLKALQSQVTGNTTAEREFNASLSAGQMAAKNKLAIMEAQRKTLAAAEKVGISSVAVTIGKAAIDPVKQFATDSMKILSEFDDKMAAVNAVVGPTAEQLKGLRKQAAALGASTRYDAAQAAEAMGELGSAGFTAQQITIGLSDTLSLASAGALGLAEAAEISASALNGFGMDVNELGHVVDSMAVIAARTNAGIQDIGETMKYAAPQAALFGATIEETTALIGTMANAGIKGSSGGTALRSMFTRLASPTGPALATLDGMGVKVKDATGKLRNVMEIMDDLQAKMGLNSADLAKQQNFFKRVAASGEDIDVAIAKLKASGDKQADNIKTIKTLVGAEAMGAFSTALQQQAKTKQAVYSQMAASFDQEAFKQVLMATTAENKNFDKLRALYADKTSAGQEKFKKLDIYKYISESTASYTEATALANKATQSLASQGASQVKGDDLKLVQKSLAGFKDTDEQFAEQFKDVDFSNFANGTDLLAALVSGTGDAQKGMYQFQAALKSVGIAIPAFVGAGKNMADVMEDSLAGDIRNMESALDSLRLNAIEPFEPIIRGVINSFSNFVNTIANLPTPIVALVGVMGILTAALGAILLAGGSIGIILFGFEQAAATASIATTVLEGSTIALTGFFGTTVAATAATNPFNTQLNILRGTAGKLVAPLGALKTLMFELGRAMLAQMMSPLGLTLIGLTGLYLIFEALTPQFDVLGRVLGMLVAPFGFIYGFAVGIGKALTTLITPLVKIGTTAAGFPFVSVAKSLALAVDYFAQFATQGEAAGRAFIDYFASPIVAAATWIASAWNGAIGRIQSGMDGLVQHALDIAQMLINALNHSPTEKIPDSWDGATERITAGLSGLVKVAKTVAAGMVSAFNWAVESVANVPGIGGAISRWLTNSATQAHGYLAEMFDFDVASILIDQMEAGTGNLEDYFKYFGKTLLPGFFATWMAGPLSAYYNKFTGLAGTFTGLKFEDLMSIEDFNLPKTLEIFDRIQVRTEDLIATFRSGMDLFTAAFAVFNDPNNTASIFSKSIDLISNSFSALSIELNAAWNLLGVFLGGALISVLPTIGVGIELFTIAVQGIFKTITGGVVVAIALFQAFGTALVGAASGVGRFFSAFDPNTFFSGLVGSIDRVTTALQGNLNVLSLFALIGSTLPLGFIFSKKLITAELFKAIPDFYKAVALLLPAGMGTLIASGLSADLLDGMGQALAGFGTSVLDIAATTLDWYGILDRAQFDAAIESLGAKFDDVKAQVTGFAMGLYQIPTVGAIVDGSIWTITHTLSTLSESFTDVDRGVRAVFGLLKTGIKVGDFNVSFIDLLGLDIAIKAAQGFIRLISLESFQAGVKAAGTSLKGLGGVFMAFIELFKAAGSVLSVYFQAAIPPILDLFSQIATRSIEAFTLIKSGVVDLSNFIFTTFKATLRALVGQETYDILAGRAKQATDAVVAVAEEGKKQAIKVATDTKAAGAAIVEAVESSEAIAQLGRFGRFLKFLATTPLAPLVPVIEFIANALILVAKTLYAFPTTGIMSAVGFLRALPFPQLIAGAKLTGTALYDTFEIVRFGIDSLKSLAKDGGKALYFLNNFWDIYRKTGGFADFGGGKGIKGVTPLDMLLATSRSFNSELNKVSLTKLFAISGSLDRGVGSSLELANILKNFGAIQKAALLPGVMSYIAAWAGAGLIIYPVLKGLIQAAADVAPGIIGAIASSIGNGGIHLGLGLGANITAGIITAIKEMSLTDAIVGTIVVALVGAVAAGVLTGTLTAIEAFGAVAGGMGLMVGLSALTKPDPRSPELRAQQQAAANKAKADKLSLQLGRKVLATEVGRLGVLDKTRAFAADTGDTFKSIPGQIAKMFKNITDGVMNMATTVLALLGTFGILAAFMGKDIRLIIKTALGGITDPAGAVGKKVGRAWDIASTPGEKIRQMRSDRKVDKDRTAIDKEESALKGSSSFFGRSFAKALNATGKFNKEIIPENERLSRAANMPRRAELNLLDRQVNQMAEANLKASKVKGDANGKSGMWAKYSTAQIEAEAARVYQNEKQIRAAAFGVADRREAQTQTDKNVAQKALEQLAADPTVQKNKFGKFDRNQIEAQETKIRADKNQMKDLLVGNVFRDLSQNMSLAGTEALKGLGNEVDRQKFIEGQGLIDEDLTIKAKNVELYVGRLNLGKDEIAKKSEMTAAALAVFNQELNKGTPTKEVKLDADRVEEIYKSFSRLSMRPSNNEFARYGAGNNLPANIIQPYRDGQDRNDPQIMALGNRSILNRQMGGNTTLGAIATSNIARAGENLSTAEAERAEAELALQIKELSLVIDRISSATFIDKDYLGNESINELGRKHEQLLQRGGDVDYGFLNTQRAAGYLGGDPANSDPIVDAAKFKDALPQILANIYGENNDAALQARAKATGSLDPTASISSPGNNNVADLELLKQAMVDLISQIHAIKHPEAGDRQIQGAQMALVARMIQGSEESISRSIKKGILNSVSPDSKLGNEKLDYHRADDFKQYAMKSQGVNPGDVNYEMINTAFDAQRARVLETMSKDLQFFQKANGKFAQTLIDIKMLGGQDPMRVIDLLTSPDLVSDANFTKLINGAATDLEAGTEKLLKEAFAGLSASARNVTPAMRKNLGVWNNDKAQRSAAAARMVGLDVDAEVARGIGPADLAIKAAAAREELGFAMQSFMALAIPSNEEIKAAMTRTYEKLGVGNTIDWNEVLPMPKGQAQISNADRYGAISSYFDKSPAEIAAKQTEASFMLEFQNMMEQEKGMAANLRADPTTFMKNLAKTTLMGGRRFDEAEFDKMTASLGLTEEIAKSKLMKDAVIAAAVGTDKQAQAKILADGKLAALGQAYLKQKLPGGKSGSGLSVDVNNFTQAGDTKAGFDNFISTIQGNNPDRATGKQDFQNYLNQLKAAQGKGGIEAVLAGLINQGSLTPQEHADKIRTAAELIANGQLDLLAPDLLIAVSRHTKRSVAALIRPDDNARQTDKVQVNILRRMEIQRRLQAKGLESDVLTGDTQKLYKGNFRGYEDSNGANMTQTAELLNLNGKRGQEAVVELMASLSTQAVIAKHEAKLAAVNKLRWRNNQRQSQLNLLATERASEEAAARSAAELKRQAGERRYDNLMQLLIAKNYDQFQEMAPLGMPASGLSDPKNNPALDPSLNAAIGQYNLVDILHQTGGKENPTLTKPLWKEFVEKIVKGKGSGIPDDDLDTAMLAKLQSFAGKVGLTSSQLAGMEDLDIESILGATDYKRVSLIFEQMQKNKGKTRGPDFFAEMGNSNKAKLSGLKLEGLLTKMFPDRTIARSDADPKKQREQKLNEVFKGAGMKPDVEGQPKLADNFYQRVLAGAKMPLDGVIKNIETARNEIDAKLWREDRMKPDVVKFMDELAGVQTELSAAVEAGTSPIAAISKLIRLQSRVSEAELGTGLAEINDLSADPLDTKKLFDVQATPAQLVPEIFGEIRQGSGAETKLNSALGTTQSFGVKAGEEISRQREAVAFADSNEYRMAGLAASLDELTDSYQVHNKKLLELRTKFAAGADDFGSQIMDTANADLLKAADGNGELFTALQTMYGKAGVEGIELKGPALKYQLDKYTSDPSALGLTEQQLQLVKDFHDTQTPSNLTLDPTIRKVQEQITQGQMPDRKSLSALAQTIDPKNQDLEFFVSPTDPAAGGELQKASDEQMQKIAALAGNPFIRALEGEFSFGAADDRKLVEDLIAKGTRTAQAVGAAVAEEYSTIYAYVNSDTNKIDPSDLVGAVNDTLASTSFVVKSSEALAALTDIVEGRRTSIEKFSDNERLFLEAFTDRVGLSQKQLFNLDKAVPKTIRGKVWQAPGDTINYIKREWKRIQAQKDYSLNRFMERAGIDYEELTGVLKSEGFTATQITKLYKGTDRERGLRVNRQADSQKYLTQMLSKYGGMGGKQAKDSIAKKLEETKNLTQEKAAEQMQLFIERQIEQQGHSGKVLDKIFTRIQNYTQYYLGITRPDKLNLYSGTADRGLKLSERIGATGDQMKKLAALMGINQLDLDKFFTDKGGLMGEFAYMGDYFGVIKKALDPLNLNQQKARILAGTKMGGKFAAKAEKIAADRLAKQNQEVRSLGTILGDTFISPIIGSALRAFKTPAEAVLDRVIAISASSSDWLNNYFSGRLAGAKGLSKMFGGIESRFRNYKHQATTQIDQMPGIKKNWNTFWSNSPIGRFNRWRKGNTIEQAEYVDEQLTDPQLPPGADPILPSGDAPIDTPPEMTGMDKFKRAFTPAGAKENSVKLLKGTVKFGHSNFLNQGIKNVVQGIGGAMQAAAQEALDFTEDQQIVSSRDDNGVRTYVNEQRAPLKKLQKKVGTALLKFEGPMQSLVDLIGGSLIEDGDFILTTLAQLKNADLPGKLGQSTVAGLTGIATTVSAAFGGTLNVDLISPTLNNLKQKIHSNITAMFDRIGDAFDQMDNAALNSVRNVLGAAFRSIKSAFKGVGNLLGGLFKKLRPDAPGALVHVPRLSTEPVFDTVPDGDWQGARVPRNPLPLDNPLPPPMSVPIPSIRVQAFSSDVPLKNRQDYNRTISDPWLDNRPTRQIPNANPAKPNSIGAREAAERVDRLNVLRRDNQADRLLNQSGYVERNDFIPELSDIDPNTGDALRNSGVARNLNPVPPVSPIVPTAANIPPVPTENPIPAGGEMVVYQPPVAPAPIVPDPDIIDAPIISEPTAIKPDYEILSEQTNQQIEENWNGTSDSIIKNIKHVALVSKKLGYWIMRNLSEGSPGPTFYMRQHYAMTADYIEAKMQRLVKVAQRSGAAIQAGMSGLIGDFNTDDIAQVSSPILPQATDDDSFSNAVVDAEQYTWANRAAANLAHNAQITHQQTAGTADEMAAVAKGEVKVNLHGRKIAKLFTVMWKAMKIVPKGFVKMGQVFKKIGKPVMMMGAGFSAAGFAMQNISSNLSTLGVINETTNASLMELFAIFEILGGIGALGGAVFSVLGGGFAFLLEVGSTLLAAVFSPMAGVVVGVAAGVIALTFGLNELSKRFLGLDFIAMAFDRMASGAGWVQAQLARLMAFVDRQFHPMLANLKYQIGSAIGFGTMGAIGSAISWIVTAWSNGIGSISGMLVGLWQTAENVGNWLIGALNCNPTVQIPIAWQGAVDSITGMMNFLPEHAKATAEKMVGFFGNAFSWIGGKSPDVKSNVDIAKTTTETTIPAVTPAVESDAVGPDLPDWVKTAQSFGAQKLAEFNATQTAILPVDTTGSLEPAKGMQSALGTKATEIQARSGLLLHGGGEAKAERIGATASNIGDLVAQSEYLKAEYADLTNPTGWKQQMAWFGKLTGSTQQRTKEIIKQRGEIEQTLKVVVAGAKAELQTPASGDFLAKLGIDPDALDSAGVRLQAGIENIGTQISTGIESAVAPVATYWDDAMTSIAEVGVGGTAEAIFDYALANISDGVGTCGRAFNELGAEVFESLKTMDFKRLQNAGKMFTSTMGEGLRQIANGFSEAAKGAAFFAAFSVSSGFLPMLMFGALGLTLLFLTAKFGDLRKIVPGVFRVMVGAAKMFIAVLTSIGPILAATGDVFKGVFALMRGDIQPLKAAIVNLKLEFQVLFNKLGVGFADVRRGFELIKEGFQPVIDKGIMPIVAAIKTAFGKVANFFLDPVRNLIATWQQFGRDLWGMATGIVGNVGAEFGSVFESVSGAIKFATASVDRFFADFGASVGRIVGIVTGTISEIGDIFTRGMERISTAFKTAWVGIGIGSTGIEGIGKGIALVTGEITTLGGEIFAALGGATEGIRGEIGKIGTAFIETNRDLFAAFSTVFDRIGQLVPNLMTILTAGINDFTAYFTVKFQGAIDFATGIFEAIGQVASKAWELAEIAFDKFSALITAGLSQVQAFASHQFSKIGDAFAGIGASAQGAIAPAIDTIASMFAGIVRDLDNLVQSGLNGFNGLVDRLRSGFTTAFGNIMTAGEQLGASLIAIPAGIGMAFGNLTSSIGLGLNAEFTSLKTSGAELLTALTATFQGGTEQIGLLISGITGSFTAVSDSITSTIENLKATFSGLGEAIDGAMGNAFGGVKEKWQKTTGFMGRLMGKVAGDSEETGQLILHNMAENSPGPTQMIRERYAYTAESVNASLATIASAAEVNGTAIAESLDPRGAIGTIGADRPTKTKKEAFQGLSSNVARSTDFASDMLSLTGAEDAAKGFKTVSMAINGVNTALDAAKIAKEIGEDFKILQGVMQGFSAADAASKVGELATGLVESGKAAWDAIKGFGQWIVSKLFQTSVAVTAEATTAGAAVAGATATAGANTVVATTNAVAGSSFLATASAAVSAWAAILAPILPIILAIGALVGVIWFLGKAMVDNNFLGFGDLMYGIGNAIGWVWKIVTGFFGALWNGIATIGGEIWNTLGAAFMEIGNTIGSVFNLLAAPFVELFAAIGSVFSPITTALGGANSGLSVTQSLVNAILLPIKIVAEVLKFVIWCLGKAIGLFVNIAGVLVGIVLSPFMAIAKILSFVAWIVQSLLGAFVSIGGAIGGFILNPFQAIVGIVQWLLDAVGGLVNTIGAGLLGTIKAILSPFSFIAGLFGGGGDSGTTEVQKFATGGYVSGAGGPTDDKIPAMLSNGEFVVGAENTRKNLSFLEAINGGMAAEEALRLVEVPHPIGELPDRASAGAGNGSSKAVEVHNHYQVTVSFGDIVVQGATGEEAAADFSRFLQTPEFQMAIQAGLVGAVESMR